MAKINVFTKDHDRANQAWNHVLSTTVEEGVEQMGAEAFIELVTVMFKKHCNENAEYVRANCPNLIKYLDD